MYNKALCGHWILFPFVTPLSWRQNIDFSWKLLVMIHLSAIYHTNFVRCWSIATKLDMQVAGYDICIVEKYHGHRSKGKVKSPKLWKILNRWLLGNDTFHIGLKVFNFMSNFWSHNIPFYYTTYFLTLWRCFWRHDVPFTYFWRHDELLDVMTCCWFHD